MKDYEAIVVLRANLPEEKVNSLVSRFEKKITDNGGELTKVEKMGQRRIPFTIKKHKSEKEGFYMLIKFKGASNTPQALRDDFRIQEEVIRHIITCVPESEKVLFEEPEMAAEPQKNEEISGQPQ